MWKKIKRYLSTGLVNLIVLTAIFVFSFHIAINKFWLSECRLIVIIIKVSDRAMGLCWIVVDHFSENSDAHIGSTSCFQNSTCLIVACFL